MASKSTSKQRREDLKAETQTVLSPRMGLAILDEIDCILELLKMLPALRRHADLVGKVESQLAPSHQDDLACIAYEALRIDVDRDSEAELEVGSREVVVLVESFIAWRLHRVRAVLRHLTSG